MQKTDRLNVLPFFQNGLKRLGYFLLATLLATSLTACNSVPKPVIPDTPVAVRPAPKIALVLGGGGTRGFAHVGVIKALEVQGIYPDIIVGTFGKAFGVNGGFIAGSPTLIEAVRQKADTYIYTNPLSVVDCAAAISALDICALDAIAMSTWLLVRNWISSMAS